MARSVTFQRIELKKGDEKAIDLKESEVYWDAFDMSDDTICVVIMTDSDNEQMGREISQ